jgi:hypothetical protein
LTAEAVTAQRRSTQLFLRLPDLEPRFVCKTCGERGSILRTGSAPTAMAPLVNWLYVDEDRVKSGERKTINY